jgi:prevent-host-death family protein
LRQISEDGCPRLDNYRTATDNVHTVHYRDYGHFGAVVAAMNIGIAKIRDHLADALNRVAYSGERVVLERRGKPTAAIVSLDDLALLEALEDRDDVRAAKRAIAEMRRKKEKPVSWKEVKSQLGL